MALTAPPSARLAAVLVFAVLLVAPATGASSLLVEVAANGAGDFTTIQAAIDRAPTGGTGWTIIHVAAGRYFEKVSVPADKGPIVLVGDGRGATVLEFDESFLDNKGRLVAEPVFTNRANALVVRSMTIRNLAKEPGGSGGRWDAAFENYGDRVILHDVLLRGDQDTLLMYGPSFLGGPGPSRVYVHDSHIQGRGDFVASFSSAFIEDSVLETIRDRGHFLFQMGVSGRTPAEQEALVVKGSRFTGQSLDPVWPTGVANLHKDSRVYLVWNVFEFDIGANRPIAYFQDALLPFGSTVQVYGNTQNRSTLSPLIRDYYSVPGTPRLDVPVSENDFGELIVERTTKARADDITPLWLFRDWDPRVQEPRSACENGVDDDGDGRTDLAGGDPGCASLADFSERSAEWACDNGVDDDADGSIDLADPGCMDARDRSEAANSGSQCAIGPELTLLIPLLRRARRHRRRGCDRPAAALSDAT